MVRIWNWFPNPNQVETQFLKSWTTILKIKPPLTDDSTDSRFYFWFLLHLLCPSDANHENFALAVQPFKTATHVLWLEQMTQYCGYARTCKFVESGTWHGGPKFLCKFIVPLSYPVQWGGGGSLSRCVDFHFQFHPVTPVCDSPSIGSTGVSMHKTNHNGILSSI